MDTNETDVKRLMRDGQAAAKRGDKAMARTLLTQALEVESNNEQAWMWLSGVVGEAGEQTTCLENVLTINPNNEGARKGLEHLRAQSGSLELANAPANAPINKPVHANSAPPAQMSAMFPGSVQPATPDFVQSSPPQAPYAAAASLTTDTLASTSKSADQLAPIENTHNIGGLESLAPFEAPNDPGFPAYASTSSPPTQVMPLDQDLDAALPDWMRESPTPASFLGGGGSAESPQNSVEDPLADLRASMGLDASMGMDSGSDMTAPPPIPTPTASSMETDLNAWLDELSANADLPFEDGGQNRVAHNNQDVNQDVLGGGFGGGNPFPADPFISSGTPDFPPVGPYTSAPLPAPDDLPGDHTSHSQPWYLQSSTPSGFIGSPPESSNEQQEYAADGGGQASTMTASVATLECAYCHNYVPDTSLACPECRFTFFVHCPHCHELVDTSAAIAGVIEPCPYCSVDINKMELGMINIKGSIESVLSAPKETDKAWTGEGLTQPKRGLRLNFGWLVDIVWLLIIVLMVWAMTQLPTWLHLTGLYS